MKLIDLVAGLTLDPSEFDKGIDGAQKKAGGLGDSLSKVASIGGTAFNVASTAVSIAGTALAGTGAAIYAMTAKGAANADQILEMSDKYSVATDQIQRMKYAAELVDVPLETMLGSFSRLTMSMGEAKDGTSEQAQLFAQLGVDVTDSTGNLRSANEVWMDTVGALGGIGNSAERDAVSLKLFGRSAMELNPLIVAGTDALRELGDEAQASGYVMTESQLKSLGGVDDAIQKMKRSTEGVLNQLAGIFAPGIASVVDTVGGYMGKLGSIIGDESLSSAEKIGAATELVQTIATDIAENLPQIAQSGISILQAIIQGLMSSLPTLMPAIVQVIMSIVQFIVQMLPLILDGALKIVIALAQGLAQALPSLIPAIVQMLMTIVQVLLENLPMLIEAGLQIIIGLIQGIVAALPLILDQLPVIIVTIVEVIIQSLPMLLDAAIKIIFALIDGLIKSLPSLIAYIPQIIMGIVKALIGGIPQLLQVGKNLMSGFWEGIKSMFTAIWDGIGNFVSGVVDKVKNFLGIHSDSKVMIEMAHHFGGGWITGLAQMQNSVQSAMVGFTGSITGTLPSASAGMAQGAALQGNTSKSFSFQIFNPVGESSEQSTKNTMQKLSYLGVT
jgi:hypothetical protein